MRTGLLSNLRTLLRRDFIVSRPTSIGNTRLTLGTLGIYYGSRTVTSATSNITNGLRNRLTAELKSAMKSRDTFSSTVLRSVIADVYAADKVSGKTISDVQIASILKKASARRADSASQYNAAARTDLAAAEEREAKLIASLLPPSIPDEQVEAVLKNALKELKASGTNLSDPKRSLGLLLKAFYQQVDKSAVDGQVAKQKAEVLLANS